MMKLVLTPLAAVALAAPALASTPLSFTWEGHQIVGNVYQKGRAQRITGRDLTTGRDFDLVVEDGYVHGDVGGQFVSYPAPPKKRRAATAG
jgi:hypothetical protein